MTLLLDCQKNQFATHLNSACITTFIIPIDVNLKNIQQLGMNGRTTTYQGSIYWGELGSFPMKHSSFRTHTHSKNVPNCNLMAWRKFYLPLNTNKKVCLVRGTLRFSWGKALRPLPRVQFSLVISPQNSLLDLILTMVRTLLHECTVFHYSWTIEENAQ